jgi:G:T-mismatch repair DNA endonuclease (very short patch repair protein)
MAQGARCKVSHRGRLRGVADIVIALRTVVADATGGEVAMVDVLTPEQRSFNMSRIRGRDTKPDLTLRR